MIYKVNKKNIKEIVLYIISILFFLISFSYTNALSIPFVSKYTEKQEDVGTVSVNINGVSYSIDKNSLGCENINISNGRVNCIRTINGEETIIDSLIIADSIDFYGTSSLSQNIAISVSLSNGETYDSKIERVPFSIYSNYTYQIDGYYPSEFVSKDELKTELDNIETTLTELEENYVLKGKLSALPLSSNNESCNPEEDDDCNYTYVQFLKKDPVSKKVNLDLLINYGQ